jgi:hypothetical protein
MQIFPPAKDVGYIPLAPVDPDGEHQIPRDVYPVLQTLTSDKIYVTEISRA